MPRADLDIHFQRIDDIISEIERFVPEGTKGAIDFRADLAGLLIVSMAASYESCVKDVMVNHASSKHIDFQQFVNNQYEKLSSRVTLDDLHRYTKLFDKNINERFKRKLDRRKKDISDRTGKNIETRYKQILSWRHEFAHAGIKNTTIGEAIEFHLYAKRVLYCFDEAFC